VPALSPRERTIVGAGALLACAIGGHVLVAEPLLARARNADALVPAREAVLERHRLLVAERPRLAAEAAALGARLEAGSARLLRGPTAPLAAAELQRLVKERLPAGRVEVRSERVLPARAQHGLQEIGLELTLAGTLRDTVTGLAGLEQHDRLLVLQAVRIQTIAATQPREVSTTVTVAGYLLSATGG